MAMKYNKKSEIVGQWYKDYSRLLLKNSYKLVKDYELSKDMVNSTFERIIKKFDTINNLTESARVVYLVQTNKSVCIDYLRKQKIVTVSFDELELDSLAEDIGMNEISNVEFVVDLEKSLSKLKERDRNLILGKYVWNMTEEELGKLVHIGTRSVHSAVNRAINRLKIVARKEVQIDEQK